LPEALSNLFDPLHKSRLEIKMTEAMPLIKSVLNVAVFTIIGLILFGLAFFIMGKVTPFSLRKEIEEDQNIALAIVIASVIIGIAMIVVAAMTG
jgi:putative membrane protein